MLQFWYKPLRHYFHSLVIRLISSNDKNKIIYLLCYSHLSSWEKVEIARKEKLRLLLEFYWISAVNRKSQVVKLLPNPHSGQHWSSSWIWAVTSQSSGSQVSVSHSTVPSKHSQDTQTSRSHRSPWARTNSFSMHSTETERQREIDGVGKGRWGRGEREEIGVGLLAWYQLEHLTNVFYESHLIILHVWLFIIVLELFTLFTFWISHAHT